MVDAVEYQSPAQGITADGRGAGGAGGDDHNNKRPRRTSGHRDEDAYLETRQDENGEGEERASKKARLTEVQDVKSPRLQEMTQDYRPVERPLRQPSSRHTRPYTALTQHSPSYRSTSNSELPSINDMVRDNREHYTQQKPEISLPSISSLIMSPISPMGPSLSNETDKLPPMNSMERYFDFSHHGKRKSIDNRSDTDPHKSSPLGPTHPNISSPPRLRTQLSSDSPRMGDPMVRDVNKRNISHHMPSDRKKWSHMDSPSRNASSLQTPGPSPATPYGSYPQNILPNSNSPVQHNNTNHIQNRSLSRQSSRSTAGDSWTSTPYNVESHGEVGKSTSVSPIPRQNSTGSRSENTADAGMSLGNTYKCAFIGCTAAPFQTQYLLNSHANVHSDDRPHHCPFPDCPRSLSGKGFKRKNEMIRHRLVHDSPGYVCPFCTEKHKYPRPDNLQRHVRVHHSEVPKDDLQLREVLSQRPEGGQRGRRRRMAGT